MAHLRRWVQSRRGREDPGTEVPQVAQPLPAEKEKERQSAEKQRVRENISSSEKCIHRFYF